MKKKFTVAVLGLVAFALFVGVVEAQIKVTLEVKDSGGNVISGPVAVNTVAYVYGYYEDMAGNAPASALMEAYFDDGSGKTLEATLFDGNVNDGTTTIKPFTMAKDGTYEFRWDCRKEGVVTTSSVMYCRVERGLDYSTVFVVPEPGTVVGLLMALSALGLFAVRKSKR